MSEMAKKLGIDMEPKRGEAAADEGEIELVRKARSSLNLLATRLGSGALDMLNKNKVGLGGISLAMTGIAEAGLHAVAASLTADFADETENAAMRAGTYLARGDDLLFAALLTWAMSANVRDPHGENAMEVARSAYAKLTGKEHRDVFLFSCACDTCKDRRAQMGIPEPAPRAAA